MNAQAHSYEDKLLDFAYGELPTTEARAIEAHVKGCARCTEALDSIRGVRRTMSQLAPESAPDAGLDSLLAYAQQAARRKQAGPVRDVPRWRRWVLPLGGVAAAMVVAVVAVETLRTQGPLELREPARASTATLQPSPSVTTEDPPQAQSAKAMHGFGQSGDDREEKRRPTQATTPMASGPALHRGRVVEGKPIEANSYDEANGAMPVELAQKKDSPAKERAAQDGLSKLMGSGSAAGRGVGATGGMLNQAPMRRLKGEAKAMPQAIAAAPGAPPPPPSDAMQYPSTLSLREKSAEPPAADLDRAEREEAPASKGAVASAQPMAPPAMAPASMPAPAASKPMPQSPPSRFVTLMREVQAAQQSGDIGREARALNALIDTPELSDAGKQPYVEQLCLLEQSTTERDDGRGCRLLAERYPASVVAQRLVAQRKAALREGGRAAPAAEKAKAKAAKKATSVPVEQAQ